MRRRTGEDLNQALEERNISTQGLPTTDSAKQAVLAEHLRDEREEILLAATTNLANFTRKLARATYVVAFATVGLVLATIALIVVTLLIAK